MGPGLKLIYPPITDYYSQSQVDSRLDTLSSNLITYIDQQYAEEYNNLLTTSGDLVSWILSKNYTTEIQLATTSGDIVAQVASGTGGNVILEGLCGLVTTQVGDTWYIDPCDMLIPATVSGVTLSGTGGMVCTFYPDPTESGTGYWLIDGSNLAASINLEYTTVYGTAGSGNGIFWGNAMFTGSGGTTIYHQLGTKDHSTLITPGDDLSFDIDKSAMLGEVYVQKGIDYDVVYTTGSGSYGQNFSWMVIQGWPWNPNIPQGHLLDYLEITSTTSGAIFGSGQDTGIEVTVSGGSWLLNYNVYYQMNSANPGVNWGYAWVEDGYRVIPGSHTRLAASLPTQSGVDIHSSNISFASSERGRTYKLVVSKDIDAPADQMLLLGGSGDKNSRSSLLPIPVSHMGIGASQQYGGSLVTLDGSEGVKTLWNEIDGVWEVFTDPPTLPFHGSGGIELTAVSGGLWIDGTNVIGDGGIRYMVGSGTGISWGEDTFAGMTGRLIQHDLGTSLHSTQITAGGDDVPTATGIAAIGGIYVTKGPNTDIVYNTGDAGEPFSWIAARGFPVYTSIDAYTGENFTITGTVSQPTYGQGQDICMEIRIPPGTWNLFYSVAYNLADGAAGLDKAYVWLEDDAGIVDRSTAVLTAWNPMQSYNIQYASHMIHVAPTESKTYTMKAASDVNYQPEVFTLYGNSTSSGSLCTLVALPADANGFFGHDGPTTSGSNFLILGTNGIDTTHDLDGNWTVDASNMHEHIKIGGKYGIQTYVSDGKLWIDGSNFGMGSTLVSGVEVPHGEEDHSQTIVDITSRSLGPQFGGGQDTGLEITVSGGNWNVVYSLSYQIQSDSFGTNDCFAWLEDDYGVIPNSSVRLRSMSPTMNYMIHNVSNVVNVTPPYTKTYYLRASKYPQDYSNNFYLYGGATASGAQCNRVALPAVYGLGDSSSLIQVSGTNNIQVYYENGTWFVDGSFLNDLRSGWDSSGEGVYSTAKQDSLDSTISITSMASLPVAEVGQDTGLRVTVGSGSWNISYSLTYELVKNNGYAGALLWIQDDFDTVVSGSSKFIGDFSPIASYGKKNVEHMFTLTTASARQYTLYAARHSEFTPDYMYLYGGVTASGATSSLLAWSPEVYATDINLMTGDVIHNHYITNDYHDDYYVADSIPGLVSDGLNVTISGDLMAEGSITASGIRLAPENLLITTFAPMIKSLCGGRMELSGVDTLVWNPVVHNMICLHNGDHWAVVTPVSTPTILIGDAKDIAGSGLQNDYNYDVFARYVSNTDFEFVFNKWADDVTRVVEPSWYEGVLVYDTSSSGIMMRYLGMVRPTGGVFKDDENYRYVINHYNIIEKPLRCYLTYMGTRATGAFDWRELNNGIDMVRGYFLAHEYREFLSHANLGWSSYNASNGWVWFGTLTNSTTNTPSGMAVYEIDVTDDNIGMIWTSKVNSRAGLNYMTMVESQDSNINNTTYYHTNYGNSSYAMVRT